MQHDGWRFAETCIHTHVIRNECSESYTILINLQHNIEKYIIRTHSIQNIIQYNHTHFKQTYNILSYTIYSTPKYTNQNIKYN